MFDRNGNPGLRTNRRVLAQKVLPTASTGYPGVDVFQIERGPDLCALIVDIRGTIQLTTGATTISALAPGQLIDRVKLTAGAGRRFAEIDGRLALWGDFENDLARQAVAPGTTVATHPVSLSLRIPLSTDDWPMPRQSALHTRPEYLGSLDLEVRYAALSTLWSTFGAGVIGTVTLTITIIAEQAEYLKTEDLFGPRWIKNVTPFDVTQAAATNRLQIQVPVGQYLRGVKLFALSSSNNEPSDTQINSVTLRAGSERRIDAVPFLPLKAMNQATFGISPGVQTTGLAFVDATDDNVPHGMWDLRRASPDTFLELDVAATGRYLGAFINYEYQPAIKRLAQ